MGKSTTASQGISTIKLRHSSVSPILLAGFGLPELRTTSTMTCLVNSTSSTTQLTTAREPQPGMAQVLMVPATTSTDLLSPIGTAANCVFQKTRIQALAPLLTLTEIRLTTTVMAHSPTLSE